MRYWIVGYVAAAVAIVAFIAYKNAQVEANETASVATAAAPHDSAKSAAPAMAMALGEPAAIPNFGLIDHTGRFHELHRYGADHKAIVLYIQGNGCPIVRKSFPRLKEIRAAYEPKGVKFLMLNANFHDDRESVAGELAEFDIDMPVLLDRMQIVASQLNVERTCEAFVVDTKDWSIKYRGAVSDQFDYLGTRQQAVNEWLSSALDAFLAGEAIAVARTEPKGCLLNLDPMPEAVSYANDVAPVLRDKCVTCHSPGNIAPFAFDSYERTHTFAEMMKEVVMTQRMPPWHADPHYQTFENDRALSEAEARTLIAWVDQGAKRDGDADPLAGVKEAEAPKWPLGEPDLVVQLPEPQHIAATGYFDYTYVDVPSGLTEDKYVRAVDVRPSNREVTHHALVFAFYPRELRDRQPEFDGGLEGYFAGYLPGQGPTVFPEGSGQFLPAGSTFQFQLHYNTTGKPETDQTEMAVYFHDEPPALVYGTTSAHNEEFEIQPNDPDSAIAATKWIGRDITLYGMSPHLHYRGSRVKYDVKYPDGSVETLLSVPNYNFDWQTMYTFAEPKAIPAGSVIMAEGAWDNSARNPYNPDPNATVKFGDQTIEEMFVCYFTYTVDPNTPYVAPPEPAEEEQDMGLRTGIPIDEKTIVGGVWRVDRYRFRFEAGGKLVVNDAVNGTWEIRDGRVYCNVAGRDPVFRIEGDLLTTGRNHVFPRLE